MFSGRLVFGKYMTPLIGNIGILVRMFEKNTPLTIFRFLDEKTSFVEELRIASSFSLRQISWFLMALIRRLF